MEHKKLFNFAISIGDIMLRNGAETSRVEDTINRILKTSQFTTVESFVTPTGIFATLDDPSIDMITYVKRVHKRDIHLYKVALANDLSRRFCSGSISLDEAYEQLNQIKEEPPYNEYILMIAKGLASGFFTIVFGGKLVDMIVSMIVGFVLAISQMILSKYETSKFFTDIIGGSIIALTAIVFYHYIGLGTNFDLIVVGAIMPLVPGVAITNAIRDTIQGDFISGVSRTADAFIVATSIAVGVGIVLKLFYVLTGGILN